MPRAISTLVASLAHDVRLVIVLALLVSSTVAFVVTERLKLEPAPISKTHVTRLFAPECVCATHVARISFRFRRKETVSLSILGRDDRVVRTVVEHERVRRGTHAFIWDGRDNAGMPVPEGSYRPRIELAREQRTIVIPNWIQVDRTPPTIRLLAVSPTTISPDGDGRSDRVKVRYLQSEPGQPMLLVNGVRRVRVRFPRRADSLEWYGRIKGRPLRPGMYHLELTTRDLAGNLATHSVQMTLRVRYIELDWRVVSAVAGRAFAARVATDAHQYAWRFAKRTGVSKVRTLHLTAPRKVGRYRLVVSERGFHAQATVVVRRPQP